MLNKFLIFKNSKVIVFIMCPTHKNTLQSACKTLNTSTILL
jgi:hypothetical protein